MAVMMVEMMVYSLVVDLAESSVDDLVGLKVVNWVVHWAVMKVAELVGLWVVQKVVSMVGYLVV